MIYLAEICAAQLLSALSSEGNLESQTQLVILRIPKPKQSHFCRLVYFRPFHAYVKLCGMLNHQLTAAEPEVKDFKTG